MLGVTAATKSGIGYEHRTVCRSPRSETSSSDFCCGRDGDYADREFNFDDLVLSSFASERHASVQSKSVGHHHCRNSRGLAGRGRVMEGGGFGLIGDLIVGLIGAFIGDWLLPRLSIHLGTGIVSLIINAFIGAVILLLILRLVGGGGWGYGRRWGRRWR
jgi:uncharacterized membrane protein YeaQ/YmgE (transglycosylase-associated protein family)